MHPRKKPYSGQERRVGPADRRSPIQQQPHYPSAKGWLGSSAPHYFRRAEDGTIKSHSDQRFGGQKDRREKK